MLTDREIQLIQLYLCLQPLVVIGVITLLVFIHDLSTGSNYVRGPLKQARLWAIKVWSEPGGHIRVLTWVGAVILAAVSFSVPIFRGFRAEAVSIAIAVIVIDELARYRNRLNYKKSIIHQLGSLSNDFALDAARICVKERWHKDGSLKGAFLLEANLENVRLGFANLEDATLSAANLKGACLGYANLENADLRSANLTSANLYDSNLSRAILVLATLRGIIASNVNLEKALLESAFLEGAYLAKANLKGAKLRSARLEGANLEDALLKGSDLYRTHLEGALLGRAHLEDANLRYAHLEGADLGGVNLTEVKNLGSANISRLTLYNDETIFPEDSNFPNVATNIFDLGGEEQENFLVEWRMNRERILKEALSDYRTVVRD